MKKILLFAATAMVVASASYASEKQVKASFFDGTGAAFGGWGGSFEQVEEDDKPCLKYSNAESKDFWAAQMAIDLAYETGTTYYISMDVKGSGTEEITSGYQYTGKNAAGNNVYEGCGDMTKFSVTPEWKTVVIQGTAGSATVDGDVHAPNRWVANLGQYVGDLFLTNVTVYTESDDDKPTTDWASIIKGGVAADGETEALQAHWNGPAKVVDNPAGDGKVFECPIAENTQNKDGGYDDWNSQMFICFDEALQEGDVVKVEFDYYCTDTRTVGMQAQGNMGGYQGNFAGFEAKPEWQHYSKELNVSAQNAGEAGFKTIAICLSSKAEAATFYMNNVVVEKQVEGAVETVTSIKVNSAVYNLQGVKVADSLNQVAAPGLYISNGKKVIKK